MHLLSELYSTKHPSSTQDALTTLIYQVTGIELPKMQTLTDKNIATLNQFETDYFVTIMDMLERDILAAKGSTAPDPVRKELDVRYVFWLASFIITIGFIYIFSITWLPIPDANVRIADTITGVFIGTIIVTVINHFFSKDRQQSATANTTSTPSNRQAAADYTKQPYILKEPTTPAEELTIKQENKEINTPSSYKEA